jgi:Type IV leader peptidase family.
MIASLIFLFILLALIVYQDFKSRSVHVVLFIGILVLLPLITFPGDINYWFFNSLVNMSVVLTQIIASFIFLSIKNRRYINIVNTALGSGDIVMLGIFSLNFSVPIFIIIILISLVVALIQYWVCSILQSEEKSIPLAGVMALVLEVLLCLKCLGIVDL